MSGIKSVYMQCHVRYPHYDDSVIKWGLLAEHLKRALH